MYKSTDYEYEQLSFINFNMACGMQLDMNNEWIHIAQKLPWRAWETLYVAMFPSNTGNVAKPCRMVLGALIIQTRLGFSDREFVAQLRQNPYYQYFIGLASFQYTAPFTRTLLVEWRKRIDFQFAVTANNLLCDAAPKAFRFRKKQGAAYIDRFMQQGYAPAAKFCDQIITIHLLYDQQKYMYDNKTHSVENRIVSISQPYVRPVVRGKAKAPTEFGAKLHLSIDETGFGRIEFLSFDAFNEGPMLIEALNAYRYRNGHYPKRVLVDKIYRTQDNIRFCNENGIRISGPKLGRPVKDANALRKNRKTTAQDNTDRIEIERYFSTAKRRNGMGRIARKREDTSLSTIAMSVLVTNIFGTFKLAVEEFENKKLKSSKS